jgi:hypothetical protein
MLPPLTDTAGKPGATLAEARRTSRTRLFTNAKSMLELDGAGDLLRKSQRPTRRLSNQRRRGHPGDV